MAKTKKQKKYLLPALLSIILLILIFLIYQINLSDKYYPQTFALNTNISFLNQGQAIRKVQAKFALRSTEKLQFEYPQGSFTIDLATSSARLNYNALGLDYKESHSGTWLEKFIKQFRFLFSPNLIIPEISLKLDKQIQVIETIVNKPPANAQLIFDEITTPEGSSSANIQIMEEVNGLKLNKNKLEEQVVQFMLTGQYNRQLSIASTSPQVTTEHIARAKSALGKTLTEPIKLTFQEYSWTLDAKQLLTLLDLSQGLGLLDKDRTLLYLGKIAKEIDKEVQEGLFEFNHTTRRVSAFRPSIEGRKLDLDKTYQLLIEILNNSSSQKTINLPVSIIKPKITTSDVNSLGIKELLGRGISNFAGSIENRIYNIKLTAQKINGILIPPGEIFSFNQTVGDITAATGFKQAYVIKEGRTVLDDGGGVCQDSTTLFRSVLNAGLPIIKRTAHAYRVGYYEQGFPPGLDATVFYPSVDFQFKNDTPAHILIQAVTLGTTLYVDLYGTADGREVNLTRPVITNQTPPPPELRQDDPNLPRGTVKQVDWSAWGATVTFSRTVTRGEETLIKETFKSNYKSWQAVYLVGTQ